MDTIGEGSDCHLAAECDHRIANHMAVLASYVRVKVNDLSNLPDAPDKASVLLLVEGIGAQIAAVSELHRMLSASASPVSGDIGTQLERICAAFRAGPACNAAIVYSGDPGCILPLRQILPVSQIVSEVMTNALKYGHKVGLDGLIRVSCRQDEEGHILISVDDEGDGLPGGNPAGETHGIGAWLIEALARQVDGTIGYQSSAAGLSFSLSLPSAERILFAQRRAG